MRSQLRINDLKGRTPTATRLMNVKVPSHLTDAIDKLSKQLGVPKTDVVVALLNEGLAVASTKLPGRRTQG